ncbi:hypothetical protein AgCh_028553 [Apium graveolens]
MPPYEVLYGRRCRSPLCWDEVGEHKIIGPELVQQTKEMVGLIRKRLVAAQDRQKKYADQTRNDREYEVGDSVLLKVSPWKGVMRFGRKGKLSLRFIGSFQILRRIGLLAYELALPPNLQQVHNVFHVSMLRTYHADARYVIEYEQVDLQPDLTYIEQPVRIMDQKEQMLRNKTVKLVRILWRNQNVEESTWELQDVPKTMLSTPKNSPSSRTHLKLSKRDKGGVDSGTMCARWTTKGTACEGKRKVKEQVKAITLRSGKVASPEKSQVSENEVVAKEEVLKDTEVEPRKKTIINTPPEGNTGENQVYHPPPFPKWLQKQKLDKQFAKFLEVFKKLHINIPFVEALEQIPSYAKFMKGIFSRKVKLDDLETISLREECSVVLQQKLPLKLKDPGSFTFPCTIGNLSFDKCICDLGASINLMPLSIFKKLGLPNPKPTYMSLQLVDRSITYLRGIVEDVLVKVDKLIFPADFVILDFEEDKKIPIILGRPFLATGRTLIDV